jgi:hypothetical protein
MQSDFDKSFLSFRRAVDGVFNNRDSRSGKLIKPHDVEGQRSTFVDDIYFNQTPILLRIVLNSILLEIQFPKCIAKLHNSDLVVVPRVDYP